MVAVELCPGKKKFVSATSGKNCLLLIRRKKIVKFFVGSKKKFGQKEKPYPPPAINGLPLSVSRPRPYNYILYRPIAGAYPYVSMPPPPHEQVGGIECFM